MPAHGTTATYRVNTGIGVFNVPDVQNHEGTYVYAAESLMWLTEVTVASTVVSPLLKLLVPESESSTGL